jgi:hypothetical protein
MIFYFYGKHMASVLKTFSATVLGTLLMLVAFYGIAHPLEHRFGADVFAGLFQEENLFSEISRAFDQNDRYAILGAYPELRLDFENNVRGAVLGELEWIHSWEAASDDRLAEDETTAGIARAYLGYTSPSWSVDAGKMPFFVAGGRILSSEEPGASFAWGGRGKAFARGDAFMAFDQCPMAALTWGFRPAFYETFEVTAVWFRDRENRLAELFRPWFFDDDIKSSGDLYWIGGNAEFFLGDAYLTAMAFYQFGAVSLDFPRAEARMDVDAYIADVEASYNITDTLSVSGYVFLASGDRRPLHGDVEAFLSPMPFHDRSPVFFSGGFERYDRSESFRLAGVTWAGAASPGLTFSFYDPSGFSATACAAMMFPDGELMDFDDWIGWEADVALSYEYDARRRVLVEGGMFFHGDYVRNIGGVRPDPARRLSISVELSW